MMRCVLGLIGLNMSVLDRERNAYDLFDMVGVCVCDDWVL